MFNSILAYRFYIILAHVHSKMLLHFYNIQFSSPFSIFFFSSPFVPLAMKMKDTQWSWSRHELDWLVYYWVWILKVVTSPWSLLEMHRSMVWQAILETCSWSTPSGTYWLPVSKLNHFAQFIFHSNAMCYVNTWTKDKNILIHNFTFISVYCTKAETITKMTDIF